MPKKLPSDSDKTPIEAVMESLTDAEKRSNWMILVGTPNWVRGVIHRLHSARITEVRDWSRLMPTRNVDEVISVMQRPRVEE
ncbi:hypothetical protein K9N68_16575 [Kovacikia minuta CCNUW1]|uniref:hypothetical protein n=1 Tax=Kovacikia minuta TaxID=2931930 RepID=UPI001CC9DF1E|nr:hypothetical protein [Kovacikia minuta]UBF29301.1 hypothetical protein K9N68_16575 [Kovacikia minuta CCNUW1]